MKYLMNSLQDFVYQEFNRRRCRILKTNCKELKVATFNKQMKEYALELYIIQCMDSFSEKEKEDESFDIEDEKEEIKTYFDYIYKNLEYPE